MSAEHRAQRRKQFIREVVMTKVEEIIMDKSLIKGELSREREQNMERICHRVIATLRLKNPKYGESWKSHGGFSAFFNMQRKFSRIDNLSRMHGYDIFHALNVTGDQPDGMIETILDEIGYLLLILDECCAYDPAEGAVRLKAFVTQRATSDDCTCTDGTGLMNPGCPYHGEDSPIPNHRCDGNHPDPACSDPECWRQEMPGNEDLDNPGPRR